MSLSVAAGLPGLGFAPPLLQPGVGMLPNLGGSINVGGSSNRRALTEGIPDPAAVQRQKESYARSLEEQLRKGVEVLAATHKQQTDLLHAQANQEKHRYNIALDQQVKQRELELSQQYNEQLMRLQQAAQVQRADLEQQACGLTLEYQQRKVQEEYINQQQGIQKQHIEAQSRLDNEIQKLTATVPGAQTLLERVQANVKAVAVPPPPLAQYALPQLGVQPPAAPVAAPTMLPYVPPLGAGQTIPAMTAPPKVGGPIVGYAPQAAGQTLTATTRSNLSYVPGTLTGAIAVAAPAAQPQRSYVPPSSVATAAPTVKL